jgi:hypothetical protein
MGKPHLNYKNITKGDSMEKQTRKYDKVGDNLSIKINPSLMSRWNKIRNGQWKLSQSQMIELAITEFLDNHSKDSVKLVAGNE